MTNDTLQELKANVAYEAWQPEKLFDDKMDIRVKILHYAILSANTHNIQPWHISLTADDCIRLFIDPAKVLPDTDPDYRHVYISQGTFLETLQIAATKFGYRANIKLFPFGINTIEETGQSAIAEITLEQSHIHKDDLFQYITQRHTSHYIFNKTALTENEKMALLECHTKNKFSIQIIDSKPIMRQICDLLVEAMTIQTSLEKTHLETIQMMRYGKNNTKEHCDGFTFSDLGVTGIKLAILNCIANNQFLNSSFFKKNIVKGTRKMAESASAYGVVYSPTDERIDQVVAGQVLTRIYLTTSKLGVSLQPMDHVLQKYAELKVVEEKMREILEYKGMVPQCFFRLGKTLLNLKHHTPRKQLENLIITCK